MDKRKILVAIDPVDKGLGINAAGQICRLVYVEGQAKVFMVAQADEHGWLQFVPVA